MSVQIVADRYGIEADMLARYLDNVRANYEMRKTEHDKWLNSKEYKKYVKSFNAHASALHGLIDKTPVSIKSSVDILTNNDHVMQQLQALLDTVTDSLGQIKTSGQNRDWPANQMLVEIGATWQELTDNLADSSTAFADFVSDSCIEIGIPEKDISGLQRRWLRLRANHPD